MIANIFNVQRFSIHDGSGIRTTIFFKGCPLSCLWCHNPESWSFKDSFLYDRAKCTLCGECVKGCSNGALLLEDNTIKIDFKKCKVCGECVVNCVNGARAIAGKHYTVEQIVKIGLADKAFYDESDGGVTFSGGEPLMQIDFAEEVAKQLTENGVKVDVDTSGAVPYSSLERIAKYTHEFLFDVKHTDADSYKKFIGGDLSLVLDNLEKLSKIHSNILFRMPIIGGVNNTKEHIEKVIDMALRFGVKDLYLLPYHDISRNKYNRLGKDYNGDIMSVPQPDQLEEFKEMVLAAGLNCQIGG